MSQEGVFCVCVCVCVFVGLYVHIFRYVIFVCIKRYTYIDMCIGFFAQGMIRS